MAAIFNHKNGLKPKQFATRTSGLSAERTRLATQSGLLLRVIKWLNIKKNRGSSLEPSELARFFLKRGNIVTLKQVLLMDAVSVSGHSCQLVGHC